MYKFYVFVVFLWIGISIAYGSCGDKTPITLEPFRKTVIKSPESETGSYLANATCSWVITKAENISVAMKALVQLDERELQCPGDYIRLYEGSSSTGPKIFDEFKCNPNTNRTEMKVISGDAYADFKSDNDDAGGGGFTMTFLLAEDMSKDGCKSTSSLVATGDEQFISSPNFPDTYPLNSDCSWNITATGNQTVEVVLYYQDIDNDDNCSYHRLEINTDNDTDVLCSRRSWTERTWKGDDFSISFKSDARDSRNGFLIGYKAVNVTVTSTDTKPTTATPTMSPDYFDWLLYQDFYKTYPDYYYYDTWNDPFRPTMPFTDYKPPTTTADPVVSGPTTVNPQPLTTHRPQQGFWDSMWNNLFYWNFFF